MVHKYAMALWLVDQDITSVQSVVRRRDLFFEPCAVIFEYEDPGLLGTMEVNYAPQMYLRSAYYGADEFFEIQGDEGFVWVTRATGEMLDLPPVVLYRGNDHEISTTEFTDIDASWKSGFPAPRPTSSNRSWPAPRRMSPAAAIKVLQLCFAVYAASDGRHPVDPATITGSATPRAWADR